MKLSAFAPWAGVGDKTAWTWWKNGQLKGSQTESGTIVITEELNQQPGKEVVRVVYARVSANENRPNLDAQAERLCAYCTANGWNVSKVVKEVGSGINESRRKLLAILADPSISCIVIEHKDRLTRFGFTYIETLLAVQGRSIEVVNTNENLIEDLMADLISIMYSFAARLYGQRRAKRKTEKIVQELTLAQEQKQVEQKQAVEEGAWTMLTHIHTLPSEQLTLSASCGKADQKRTTPRAHTTLCEDFGYVAFLQEDPTGLLRFHATAFLSRPDGQWYVTIQTAYGQSRSFPLAAAATGGSALALCAWLNNLAELVIACRPQDEKEDI